MDSRFRGNDGWWRSGLGRADYHSRLRGNDDLCGYDVSPCEYDISPRQYDVSPAEAGIRGLERLPIVAPDSSRSCSGSRSDHLLRYQTLSTAATRHAHDDEQRWPTLKPPLKWAGGKRWLVPHIRPHWRGFTRRRLVEPFCGGLAMALGLDPSRALLNDVNPHLANFYRHLQRGLVIKIPMRNESELYYRHRDDFNRAIATRRGRESRKAAELFYYLNRTGFNGLCRFNQRGEFNVPFGRHRKIIYTRDFRPHVEPLSRWTFTCRDFESVDVSPNDFIYADPPYDVQFRQYASDGFDWDAQERLAAWLAQHRGPVFASNQATDRIVKLYRNLGFKVAFLDGPRNISRTGDRSPAREILATRNIK